MTECPNCGTPLPEHGYEFGTDFKIRCYKCSCGTRVYVQMDTPEELKEKMREYIKTHPKPRKTR